MPVRLKNKGLPAALGKGALLLFFLLVIFIVGSIFHNLGKRNRQPEAVNSMISPIQSYHEKFQALDFAGEKMRLSLKADRFSIDDKGRQHLEGNVEIIDEEPGIGVRIKADRMVLEPQKKLARAEGEVSLVSEDLRLTVRKFEYDLKDKVAKAVQVRLEMGALSLNAGGLIYWAKDRRLKLEEGFAGEIRQAKESFFLSGSSLMIEPDGLSFQGNEMKLALGLINLAASGVRFRLQEDGFALDSVSLEGGASARCRVPAEESEPKKVYLFSERLLFQAGREASVIRAPEAFEVESSGDGWILKGRGEQLEICVENGRVARWLKAGSLSSSLKEAAGEEFRLSGQMAFYDLRSGLFQIGSQAEARHRHFIMESDRFEFRLKDRSWSASDFNLEVLPEFFELSALFFEPEKSFYISGEQLVGRLGFFDLNGRVRIWQAEEFCRANRTGLEGKTGRVVLEKLTESSWLVERSDGRKERLELRAERVALQPEENHGIFTGKVELSLGHLHLASEELILVFSAEKPSQLLILEGRGRVALSWKGYRVSGRQAQVDLAAEKLTVTGSPQLITGSGERLEADKLTLFLADDRIRLENRKRERSLTILVRGQ